MLLSKQRFLSWFLGFGSLALMGCGQTQTPTAPKPTTKRPPPEQTEFCLPDVKGAVLIADKDRAEGLGCLLDKDIIKADFSKQSVGLFRKTAACNGTAKIVDQVVYWTEFGVCGAGDETVLDFVAYFDKGLPFSDKRVSMDQRQEARELAMTKLGEYARGDEELLQFRRAIAPAALKWSLKDGDKSDGWTLAIDEVNLEKVKQTLLYRRAIATFDCSQPPENKQFVCTAKGNDYTAKYTVSVTGSRFHLVSLDETVVTP